MRGHQLSLRGLHRSRQCRTGRRTAFSNVPSTRPRASMRRPCCPRPQRRDPNRQYFLSISSCIRSRGYGREPTCSTAIPGLWSGSRKGTSEAGPATWGWSRRSRPRPARWCFSWPTFTRSWSGSGDAAPLAGDRRHVLDCRSTAFGGGFPPRGPTVTRPRCRLLSPPHAGDSFSIRAGLSRRPWGRHGDLYAGVSAEAPSGVASLPPRRAAPRGVPPRVPRALRQAA